MSTKLADDRTVRSASKKFESIEHVWNREIGCVLESLAAYQAAGRQIDVAQCHLTGSAEESSLSCNLRPVRAGTPRVRRNSTIFSDILGTDKAAARVSSAWSLAL